MLSRKEREDLSIEINTLIYRWASLEGALESDSKGVHTAPEGQRNTLNQALRALREFKLELDKGGTYESY